MPLLSDRTGFDRLACQRARFALALELYVKPLTPRWLREDAKAYGAWLGARQVDPPAAPTGAQRHAWVRAQREALDRLWEECRP